jgi:stearoyl-CoA desaturase (delta-9 desaturase)
MNNLNIQKIFAASGIASFVYLLVTGSWWWIIFSLLYYKLVVGLVGNQIAQHRYFSHRSFCTTKFKEWILYFSSLTTGVNPVWYAIAHRHHHITSDTNSDIHSPINGYRDVLSPILGTKKSLRDIKISRVLSGNQRKINKYWYVWFIIYLSIWSIFGVELVLYIPLAAVGWNYLHMIVFRVWLAHWKIPGSYQNFDNGDQSYNHKLIHFFDLGEGLHNNHHRYPTRYNQAVNSDEFDLAGLVVQKFFAVSK